MLVEPRHCLGLLRYPLERTRYDYSTGWVAQDEDAISVPVIVTMMSASLDRLSTTAGPGSGRTWARGGDVTINYGDPNGR
jgi:hypothetical protein